ncbi:hypothetical protein N7466_000282 [Penicillium verhagenii]|uniref:uncharacterized protein n=1 Tax=Penicillium verhagenii TaxID=1562060 RepID=UPI00254537BD|nr:uncharacterized protein N7466_000282 [Penicillium verhagenii]KAJ5947267.1 hypothetical protein N7466_000282 [Penicillium verhagenii]
MVYRGKPGLGCALCRQRRLACDRRRPSCSQCIRIRKECTGYRDPEALRIVDQTTEVSLKVQAHRKQSSPPRIPTPPISLDDHVMSHIFNYWVGTNQAQGAQGMIWYLPALLRKDPSPALRASITALGLASISGRQEQPIPKSSRLVVEAYGTALCAINDALKDPAMATSDSTLIAVSVLSLYEMVTSNMGKDQMHGWMNHTLGATRMLELRGKEQMNSDLGRYLFENLILVNAVGALLFRYSKHHSQKIGMLSKLAASTQDESSRARHKFYTIAVRVNDLVVKIDHAEKTMGNLQYLLGEGLLLEADLESWGLSLGQDWHYTFIDGIPSPAHENSNSPTDHSRYHKYHSLDIAGIWNLYRQTRIIVNETIRTVSHCLLGLEWTYEWEYIMFQAVDTIDQLADDVLDTVGFYLNSGPSGVGAVLRLQLPLFIAAICTDKSSERYEQILGIIEMLATVTGFKQTSNLAQRLREGCTHGILPQLSMVHF